MPLSAAINSVLVWVVSLVLSLARWLLGASSRRLLGGAAWAVATVRRVLALLSPEGLAGSLSLAYASRVRALLELAAHEEEQGAPLQRRLRGLPPPVARYLQWALGEDGNGVQYMLAHLKLQGQFRFQPGTGAAAAGGGSGWHACQAESYVSPQAPAFVWSATIKLGPLSVIRGYASHLQGAGGTWQWKLCSPFRMRDLDAAGAAGLEQTALAAFLAEAPCFPAALLPSRCLRWRALSDTTAEATISDSGVEASMVFSFGQAGQVIKASSRAALAAQAAPRGAGSVAALPRPTAAPAVYFYRNYERRCGMMVPTELEAAWCSGAQPGGGETSFAHFNLEALAAWDTLEMPPP